MGNTEWSWGQKEQHAFDMLKSCIIKDMTLLIPHDQGKFQVEANSSDYANDGVLSQHMDRKWWPVAFQSHSLNEVE